MGIGDSIVPCNVAHGASGMMTKAMTINVRMTKMVMIMMIMMTIWIVMTKI